MLKTNIITDTGLTFDADDDIEIIEHTNYIEIISNHQIYYCNYYLIK